MIQRFDFVFSYWIFIWYIFYELKQTKNNPKIAILIAIMNNIILLSLMFYYHNSFILIFLFCLVNFFIKIIPLWRLRHTTSKITDMYAFIGLFAIFIGWLLINHVDLHQAISDNLDKIKNNNPIGPLSSLLLKTDLGIKRFIK
jgi:hypothetical protein